MCRSSPPPTRTSQSPPSLQQATSSPFSIRQLNGTTYLIRENDVYGEHPHIYAKLHPNTASPSLIILIDSGVGTTSPPPSSTSATSTTSGPTTTTTPTSIWTFLATHLNPTHTLPYLLILTHCHFDHILGLSRLPSDLTLTIAASSHSKSFTTPYAHLQEHSLCADYALHAPHYAVDIWADDGAELLVPGSIEERTGLSVLHTPGHSPDSLSVYDAGEGWLYVGDKFYAQTSEDSRGAGWGEEGMAPIIFPKEGDVRVWWQGVGSLVGLVEGWEREGKGRKVRIAAGHVTAEVEAYGFLVRVRAFMGRVLRGEVQVVEMGERRGEKVGFWGENRDGVLAEFSLVAPLRVVKQGRERIPQDEWK